MPMNRPRFKGFSLVELLVFMVVLSIALMVLLGTANFALTHSADPAIQARLISLGQAQLDEIIARKYAENTPTGGVPACGLGSGCTAIGIDSGESLSRSSSLDDVDDFHGYNDSPFTGYTRRVEVVFAGTDLGLPAAEAKKVTVTVSTGSQTIVLATYRVNF